jgi:hypothetical protein
MVKVGAPFSFIPGPVPDPFGVPAGTSVVNVPGAGVPVITKPLPFR